MEEKQTGMKEGMREATIVGLKKMIVVLKNLKNPYDPILHQL
ncbi:hypothetical protein [Lactobacillus helveticus]|nr:hypothetical protein [Lactobacillus helveticus]